MRAKKTFAAVGAACVSLVLATSVIAQDDLDNLLSDLEGEQKKPAAAAPAQPAEEAKPAEEKPAEEKPTEEAKPAEEEKPVAEEKKEEVAEEAAEKPAEEAKPEVAEAKPEAEKPAEEKAETGSPRSPSAAAEEAKPVAVEAKPVDDVVGEIVATETLRREALNAHADTQIAAARAAGDARNWDEMYKQYRLAAGALTAHPEAEVLRKECLEGMAEAKYQAAKQALRESNRELAAEYAKEALKLRHPRAGAIVDALESEAASDGQADIADFKHRRHDEDYKKDRDLIRQRLRLSAQYLAVADLNKALEECDLVIRFDPYNQEAIALRDRIQRKRQMIIGKEREAARKGMIADVNAAWRPIYAVDAAELKAIDGGTMKTPVGGDPERTIEQSIEKRMKEMVLPNIAFRPPATIIDAVDYFRQASKDFDRPEIPVDQRGFNFVLQLDKTLTGGDDAPAVKDNKGGNAFGADDDEGSEGAGNVPQIPNISASNVSLWEALKLVCKISGFKFKVQGSVVMVMPKNMTTDELITRSYNVVESFLDRMNDASSGLKNEKAGDFGGGGNDDGGEENQEDAWKKYFEMMGVSWPVNSRITYIKAIGKLRVTNTADQLAVLEQALNELNVTPFLIEIETRFVEVAQEDLNSLGFEWLLNSDYSFHVGGKIAKALNLKDGVYNQGNTITETITTVGAGGLDNDTTTQNIITRPGAGTWERSQYAANRGLINDNNYTAWGNSYLGKVQKIDDDGKPMFEGDNPVLEDRWFQRRTGKNVGINAIDGANYSTGMRYLSQEGNHISGQGASKNDQFMRVNAFLGNADLSMILHMLSQRSDTDLLSAPKVVTKSGQEATIKVVTIYRFPQDYDVTIQSTSSSSSTSLTSSSGSGGDGKILPMVEPQNFETQEVGVILTCTPELSGEGQLINLTLNPKVIGEPTWKDYGMKVPMSSVMSSTAQAMALASGNEDMQWFTVPMEQPFFKERSIDTKVSIYNGATIVMGGLITEERKSMEDKIPFLGDIPFVGRFFRSRSEWSNKRNLLLFVTARLVDPRGRQMTLGSDTDTSESAEAGVTPAPADK